MPITLLYGCCQIETCAGDLDAARRFLVDVLGGVPAEEELALQISDLIPGDDYAVEHVDCGEAIFQINRPSPTMTWRGNPSVHQHYLDERGPCVTNLNYYVDDIAHAQMLLAGLGAATLIEGPSTSAHALADYGPANTRGGAEARPFLFMGTRHLVGFDLEIMEPNFVHLTQQCVQYPAFLHPRPCGERGNIVLQRLIVNVPDLDALKGNLRRIFAPASRSKPYQASDGPGARRLLVSLGGIEIEYREAGAAPVGVAAIAFAARRPEPMMEKAAAEALLVTSHEDAETGQYWQIDSCARVGFNTLIERMPQPTAL